MNADQRTSAYFAPYKPGLVKDPYPACRQLRDPQTYSSDRGDILEFIQAYQKPLPPAILISQDPPIHTALRGLVQRSLLSQAVRL